MTVSAEEKAAVLAMPRALDLVAQTQAFGKDATWLEAALANTVNQQHALIAELVEALERFQKQFCASKSSNYWTAEEAETDLMAHAALAKART